MGNLINNPRLNELPDEEIIKQILTGDKKLFELLMRKYNSHLYKVGMSILNNATEVEDIMQTAYIKAFENLAKFENRSSFSTWLIKVLINEGLLQLKKRKRFIKIEDLKKMEVLIDPTESNKEPTPVGLLINKELGHALENALMQLPEKYRLVFVLREMEDMNIAETVEVLGISSVNVKVRLNRAKMMLRDTLCNYYDNDNIFYFHLSRCDRIVNNVLHRLGIFSEE